MRAMVLRRPGEGLALEERLRPEPGPGQVLVQVRACGVCRTDLHIVDGELTEPHLPIVPGHEVVGAVSQHSGQVSSSSLSTNGLESRGSAIPAAPAHSA